MIAQLNGRFIEKNPTLLVVDCAGVGYEVKISLNTFTSLGDKDSAVVFTRLIVREDAHILYGFHSKEEREMFNHLISVSGIGPNTAIIMLSSMLPEDIAQAIQTEDAMTIQKIKGIGAKTAQRVILDLKGKVLKLSEQAQNIFSSNNTNRFDALTALLSLGFDKKAAEKALERIDTGAEPVEHLIKEALKIL
jgi:Holliday junction DNA helicase RuvA